MLEAKKYKIKEIVGCFSGASAEKKTPYIGLELETICGEFIDWVGYLTDTEFTKGNGKKSTPAKENIETLTKVGFIGKKLSDLSNEKLDMEALFAPVKNISIMVEMEEWTVEETGEVKSKPVVKYLNVGGGIERVDHKKSVQIFSNTKFDGMMKKLQGELKTKQPKKKLDTDYNENSEDNSEEDPDAPF